MQVIKYVILTNKLTETYVANADHNAIQLELDFTGTDYASWTKWVQLLMNDGTEDLKELGTDTIVHFTLTSAHTKQGYLSINPKAISADGYVKGFPIRTVSIDKQLNVEQVSSELQQSIIDYFNERLAIKSVSSETLEPDQPVDVIVQQAADGQTYLFKIPKGVKGNTGAQIVSAEFSDDDIIFTLDDGSTATLVDAAITLKGGKGDTGAQIVSAAFVGNDIVFTLDDASSVTLINAANTLKGAKGDKGIVWRGAYSAGTAYVVDDVVSYQGSSWICIQNSTGNVPTNATYWSLFAQAGSVNVTQLNAKADKLNATNLVTNGDFSNGTTGWSSFRSSSTVSSNVLINTGNGTNAIPYVNPTMSAISGNKVYLSYNFRVTNNLCLAHQLQGGGFSYLISNPVQNQWYKVSLIATSNGCVITLPHQYADASTANGKVMELKYVILIDLTAIFGAGKEPSAIQMDNLLSTFPNSWFNGTAELVSIANLAQLKADKKHGSFFTATLLASATGTLKYRVNSIGQLELDADIVIGTGTDGTTIANLPTGYRPVYSCGIVALNRSSGANTGFSVESNGNILLRGAITTGHIVSFNATLTLESA